MLSFNSDWNCQGLSAWQIWDFKRNSTAEFEKQDAHSQDLTADWAAT